MTDARWVCPRCGAAEPRIESEEVTVTIGSSQQHPHLILCGKCHVILGVVAPRNWHR
jgi:hypothetical protein